MLHYSGYSACRVCALESFSSDFDCENLIIELAVNRFAKVNSCLFYSIVQGQRLNTIIRPDQINYLFHRSSGSIFLVFRKKNNN